MCDAPNRTEVGPADLLKPNQLGLGQRVLPGLIAGHGAGGFEHRFGEVALDHSSPQKNGCRRFVSALHDDGFGSSRGASRPTIRFETRAFQLGSGNLPYSPKMA